MNILDLIEKKKNRKKINEDEFDWFIKSILNNQIPEYQISAFLMSIWFAKLDFDETYYLTKAIVNNGKIFNYPKNLGVVIDKHSTGGIGDKVSLILLPLLGSFGIKIAKISGRGLGYTGGTIDKLDSINCDTNLDFESALNILEKENFFIMQQTKEIVPADKILYSLRDTSGTVDDISLIASSIMSKKIAMNTDYIYLDVKVGDGAFFSNINVAKEFGKVCIELGKRFKKTVVVHYTDMDKPLGKCLGNIIEVVEAVDFLKGNIYCQNLKNLIYEFASDALIDLNYCKNIDESYKLIDEAIFSKKAFNKFKSWTRTQKSNFDFDKPISEWYNPKYKFEIKSKCEGYIKFLSNKFFGMVLIDLKAGRKIKTDSLDFFAGICLNKSSGDFVKANEIILTIYSSNEISKTIIESLENNIEICLQKPELNKAILGVDR